MGPREGNRELEISRSIPVGTVSERVQQKNKLQKTGLSEQRPALQNGGFKSHSLTHSQSKSVQAAMNGFISQGRVSGGKYLVTGTPKGITNYGFTESHDDKTPPRRPEVARTISFTDDLFEPPNTKHQADHSHYIAGNGTLKFTKMTMARKHYQSNHSVSTVSGASGRYSPSPSHIVHSAGHSSKVVSSINIELNNTSVDYQYRPGEDLAGDIIMEISQDLEIRFLELLIVGVGKSSLNKSGKLWSSHETYLYKKTYVLGTNHANYVTVLKPGKYVSNFRFHLPKDLPSSVEYSEERSGLRLDVSYIVKARLCGEASKATRFRQRPSKPIFKSILSSKKKFHILRPFDLNMLPDGNNPISHTEELLLACGNNSTATINFTLDRSVYMAGDDIRVQFTATIPSSRQILEITCSLQQHVSLKTTGDRASFPLIQLTNKDPDSTAVITKDGRTSSATYEVTIPTSTYTIPSFLYGCNIVTVAYSVKTVMKFSSGGGKLSISIPIALGPCAEPIYFEKSAFKKAVPVFNRPLRFPCFTPGSRNSSFYSLDQGVQSTRNILVVSKYSKTPISRVFSCCFTGMDGL